MESIVRIDDRMELLSVEVYDTDEEWGEMMLSTRDQCRDPALLPRHGKPWRELSTSELLDHLDHFFVKRRLEIAKELAGRYLAGESNIKTEVMKRLSDPEARMRDESVDGPLPPFLP